MNQPINALKTILVLSGIMIFPLLTFAQQPEQDCIGAIPICQNIYVQPNSYSGSGLFPNEVNGAISCLLAGEINGAWYMVNTQSPGNLGFTLTPVSPFDDFDWAVYHLTNASCADISTNAALEVSCNYSGTPGTTGPNGLAGNQYNPLIPVNAGETYVIYISNFSSTVAGYTLDLSISTAAFFDTIPPFLQTPVIPCNSNNLEISFGENVVCSTVNPSDFTLTGPGGPYTVTQITGASCALGGNFEDDFIITTNPPISTPGSYTLSVVDTILDNCGNVALFTSQSFNFSNLPLIVSASQNQICLGDQAVLSSNFATLPGYTFFWAPASGNSNDSVLTVSPTATTSYTLITSGPSGCNDTASLTVTVLSNPSLSIAAINDTCGGPNGSATAQISGGSAPYNYSWSTGDTSLSINNLSSGQYIISISDSNNCMAIDSIFIFAPPAMSININVLQSLNCFGDSTGEISVNANGGSGTYSYLWSTGDTSMTISGLVQGVYSVTVNDQNNCQITDSLGVVSPPPLILNLGTDTLVCDSVMLQSNLTGLTYLWSTGDTTEMIVVDTTDIYWLTVTDSSNCSATDSIYVEVNYSPGAMFTFSIDTNTVSFKTNDTVNISSYLWDFGDGDSSALANPIHVYADTGSYMVTLSVESITCGQGMATNEVIIDNVVSIAPFFAKGSINIYPNPANQLIQIDLKNISSSQLGLSLYDISGRKIMDQKIAISNGRGHKNLDLSYLVNGIYLILIHDQGNYFTKKIEVIH